MGMDPNCLGDALAEKLNLCSPFRRSLRTTNTQNECCNQLRKYMSTANSQMHVSSSLVVSEYSFLAPDRVNLFSSSE